MFAWRKRIGHISPGALSTSVYDFYLVAPEGVGLVGISNPIGDWREDEYERVLKNVVASAKYLAARHVDYINHAASSGNSKSRLACPRPRRFTPRAKRCAR